MKLRNWVLLALIALTVPVMAQSDDLDTVAGKVVQRLQTAMPGWQHKRINPVEGSNGVINDHWQSSNRIVNISVVRYDSANKARETMQPFIRYMRQKEELKGLGDEAYAWGYGLSNVIFRRGRYIVTLDAFADVNADPDARTLTSLQRGDRERSEMKRLTREFAKHVATSME